jgi:hypothetical protein
MSDEERDDEAAEEPEREHERGGSITTSSRLADFQGRS